MEKIALYGGAFDPPHLAHSAVVRAVVAAGVCDRLVVVPSGPRYDKRAYRASDADRRAMVERMVAALAPLPVTAEFRWIDGTVPATTTVETDAWFRASTGGVPLHVFGADAAANMPFWSRPDQVMREVEKLFLARDGKLPDLTGFDRFYTLDVQLPSDVAGLSSTAVRDGIARGEFSGLEPSVAQYVKTHSLYAR